MLTQLGGRLKEGVQVSPVTTRGHCRPDPQEPPLKTGMRRIFP